MPRKRALHGPTDRLLALLYGVISAPQQIESTRNDFYFTLPRVSRIDHRQYLDNTFREIETNRYSPRALARIHEELIQWQDREFPVR